MKLNFDRIIVNRGYITFSSVLNKVFNFVVALILLIITMPIFIFVSLMIKLTDRGDIFYRGVRLGKDKKTFTMYKFRTLVPDAEKLIGDRLLEPGDKLETRYGRFLRDTRLDELPQLINILKGNMNFVGPRPERPLIYETICRHIDGYNKRFIVKPGLIGYSQVFTPHSADKRIRTLIDNKFLNQQQSFLFDLAFISFTFLKLSQKVLQRISKIIRLTMISIRSFGKSGEKRKYDRIGHISAKVYIGKFEDIDRLERGDLVDIDDYNGDFSHMRETSLVDINNEAFLIKSRQRLEKTDKSYMIIDFNIKKRGKVRVKTARVFGYYYREYERMNETDNVNEFYYVIMYMPATKLSSYLINKYLIFESVS